LKELQCGQQNLAASIDEHVLTTDQRHLNSESKFQEAANERKLIYDKLRIIEAWIARPRPTPPPGDLGPLAEQGAGLRQSFVWDGHSTS
jgi:hypothetical protein